MTCFNREHFIAESIESVLASGYDNFELLIVDDQSTDRTWAIAESYARKDSRVRVYRNTRNLGDYANRNQAASLAVGKYLKYVDSDDQIAPDALSRMVAGMERYPEAVLGVSAREIDRDIIQPELLTPREAFEQHFYGDGFLENGPLAMIIRRDAFDQIGGFSGRRMIGDIELWLKLAELFPVVRLPKKMVFWRQHDGQEFRQGFNLYLVDGLQVYAEAFQRDTCPLTRNERQTIFRRKKSTHLGLVYRYAVKSLAFSNALNLYRKVQQIQL